MGLLKPTEGMTTMKERPTPETDAAWAAWPYAGPGVHANFARKLERERDEARVELTNVYRWIERNHPDGFIDSQSHLQNLERVTEHIHDKMDKLERERDEARERADSKHGLWMAEIGRVTGLEKQLERERDEALALFASEKSTRNTIIAQGVEMERQLEAMCEVLRTIREESAKIFSATAGLPDCGLIHRVAAAAHPQNRKP